MAEMIEIEGLEDVRLRLISLPIHLRKKTVYALLRKAAAPIVRAAKANAPVAKQSTKRVIPGLVRKTIGVTVSKFMYPSRGEFGVFVVPRTPRSVKQLQARARKIGKSVYFGDPFYYKFQEFGYNAVGRKRIGGGVRSRAEQRISGSYKKIPPKAFLGRAFDSHKAQALNVINAGMVSAISERFNKRIK